MLLFIGELTLFVKGKSELFSSAIFPRKIGLLKGAYKLVHRFSFAFDRKSLFLLENKSFYRTIQFLFELSCKDFLGRYA